MPRVETDFATTGEIYPHYRSMVACSGRASKKPYRRIELKTKMTDDLKVKANKAVDDARVAAHAAYDDASVATHNALKGKTDVENASDDAKIKIHKAVADVKIAAHGASAERKKR